MLASERRNDAGDIRVHEREGHNRAQELRRNRTRPRSI